MMEHLRFAPEIDEMKQLNQYLNRPVALKVPNLKKSVIILYSGQFFKFLSKLSNFCLNFSK